METMLATALPRSTWLGSFSQWLFFGVLFAALFLWYFAQRRRPAIAKEWLKIGALLVVAWQLSWLIYYVCYGRLGWEATIVFLIWALLFGQYMRMLRKPLARVCNDENGGKGPTAFKQLIGYEDDGKIDERDEG